MLDGGLREAVRPAGNAGVVLARRGELNHGAQRILSRLEFHFTPKHVSWLNMVEIEIGVMVDKCLNRRTPDKATLIKEIAAWEQRRNTGAVRPPPGSAATCSAIT